MSDARHPACRSSVCHHACWAPRYVRTHGAHRRPTYQHHPLQPLLTASSPLVGVQPRTQDLELVKRQAACPTTSATAALATASGPSCPLLRPPGSLWLLLRCQGKLHHRFHHLIIDGEAQPLYRRLHLRCDACMSGSQTCRPDRIQVMATAGRHFQSDKVQETGCLLTLMIRSIVTGRCS